MRRGATAPILRTVRMLAPSTPSVPSPALRLLVRGGRVARRRPMVVAGGLLARLGLMRGVAIWPDANEPRIAFDPGRHAAAAWLRQTLEHDHRSDGLVDPATWQALRARTLLVGEPRALLTAVAATGLGRPLQDAFVALASPSGCVNKATFFVFEAREPAPSAVVRVMADPARREWLRSETALISHVRERLSGKWVAAALPRAPLFHGTVEGEYLVVEAVDPLATYTDRADLSRALEWLQVFQAATTVSQTRWEESDELQALAQVERAWRRLRPASARAMLLRVASGLGELRGSQVPRCGVHGDFWRGNIAGIGDALRIFDWEWGARAGTPFLDHWTFELGDLRQRVGSGATDVSGPLAAAVERVGVRLTEAGLDGRFAAATLAPCLAHLVLRIRDVSGRPNGWEDAGGVLMSGVERIMLGGRDRR